MATSVGFIGLGHMGTPMARNLIKHQCSVFVCNRTKEKALVLVQEGAELVESQKEMFNKAPIVITMVSNDEALREVTLGSSGILENGKPGCIHISMSTVSPELIHELEPEHRKRGVSLVSAPVFGRPEAAEQQKLWICCAGDREAKDKVEPFLLMMGQKVFDFGQIPEMANVVKVAGNFLILSNVELLAEAFAFIQKKGGDVTAFHTLLSETLFSSPVVKGYGKRVLEQNFTEAGFRLDLGFKDIQLLLQTANAAAVPMPIAHLLSERLLSAIAKDRSELDWSAISLSALEDAGIPTSTKNDLKG